MISDPRLVGILPVMIRMGAIIWGFISFINKKEICKFGKNISVTERRR